VDKTERWQFSSKLVDFPQVFHIDLWTEKASSYGQFSGFYTYPQALLLLLDINKILKSIRFSKGIMPSWTSAIFAGQKETKRDHIRYNYFESTGKDNFLFPCVQSRGTAANIK
jgi:hypothetical protein